MTPRPPLASALSSSQAEHQQPSLGRQAGDGAGAFDQRRRRQRLVAVVERDEGLAAPGAAEHVAEPGGKAVAGAGRQQQRALGGAGEVVQQAGAGGQIDQGRDRHAVAAAARQRRHRHRIDAAVGAEGQQAVDACGTRTRAYMRSPALNENWPASWPWPLRARTQPLCDTITVTGSSTTFCSTTAFSASSISVRRASPNCLASASISLITRRFSEAGLCSKSCSVAFSLRSSASSCCDLDRFQPRQLAQADFQDVLGLALGQAESRDQRRLRLVRLADDADHFVDVQQDRLAAFQDMDAVVDLLQPELRAAGHRGEAEIDPFLQDLGSGPSAADGRRRRSSPG